METENGTERTTPSSGRRKPLSDNTNLIPIPSFIFRDPSSSRSRKPQFPSTIPEPNSKSASKPYNASASKTDANSSTSNTSIGFSTPSPRKRHEATFQPLVVYKNTAKAVGVASACLSVERIKHDANAVTDLFGHSPAPRIKNTVKEVTPRGSCSFPQGRKDKGKAVASSNSCPTPQKVKDKENVTALPLHKTNDSRKVIALPRSCPPTKKSKDTGKAVVLPIDAPLLENADTKREAVSVPFNCPASRRRKKFRDKFTISEDVNLTKPCMVLHLKHKKKRHCLVQKDGVDLPQDFIEQQRAYFKEVDEFELPVEEAAVEDSDE